MDTYVWLSCVIGSGVLLGRGLAGVQNGDGLISLVQLVLVPGISLAALHYGGLVFGGS